ncbi:ABC transporter ATP-binding protein [Fictibacillus nanhaiensis]|uniref:ABC transporter ATP-binding protein n=1 Tax=Fictibacillus nanhaiensis TaxID=742169 RepID=A0ABS2ZP81_9BACL|nr:ABC transporter ATP-binding protein [Fictibacillus nanhaiensis]
MNQSFICKGVSKTFAGDGVQTFALENINISFHPGEFISIVGSSGSGKSTLLSLLGTLDFPSSGEIFYGDHALNTFNNKDLADFRFTQIGFIFQQFHLLPSLTVEENVMAPLLTKKTNYNKKDRALSLLEMVGLKDKANALPSQLSGGQQQRVAIARALVNEPQWILADEPTGNLDSENGSMIFEIIQSLNIEKKCGVIFVTHDMNLAEKADRVIYMKDGMITEDKRGNMIC